MRSIKIALVSTAVAASVVGSAYAADACVPGSGDHDNYASPSSTSTSAPQDPTASGDYHWTQHHYRHHHHRHFGWWRGWHAGWFWHHGAPVREHHGSTPSSAPSDTDSDSAASAD